MKRYFFDIRDGNELAADEEGLELPDVEAALEEAGRTWPATRFADSPIVAWLSRSRDIDGPVVEVSFQLQARPSKH